MRKETVIKSMHLGDGAIKDTLMKDAALMSDEVENTDIPLMLKEATNRNLSEYWKQACNAEMLSVKKLGVYEQVEKTKDRKMYKVGLQYESR